MSEANKSKPSPQAKLRSLKAAYELQRKFERAARYSYFASDVFSMPPSIKEILSDLSRGAAADQKREIAPFQPASEASGALPPSPPSSSVPLGEADSMPRSGSRRSHIKNKK